MRKEASLTFVMLNGLNISSSPGHVPFDPTGLFAMYQEASAS